MINSGIVNVNTSVNLDWNAISSWGVGCPSNSNMYEVCVSSTGTCDKLNATGINSSTTVQSWTPATGGYTASWKVLSFNGSNRATSSTRTLCIENQLCTSPQCGEDRFCSIENCPNTDNGAPDAPTIISPNGTSASPTLISGNAPQAVTLIWNAVSKADRYVIGLYDSAGTLIWNPSDITTTSATTVSLAAGVYYWRVRGINDTCSVGQTSSASNWGYFRVNSAPVIGNFRIKNNSGTVIPAEVVDGQNRNHICQTSFLGSRNVRFELDVSDADGIDDINRVNLTWNGISYTLSRGTTAGIGGTYFVNVDYSGVHNSGVYGIGATVTC